MGHYPFTLFNGVTLFIGVLAILVAWRRFCGALRANWPLVCYLAIIAYTAAFHFGLNPYWVAAGVACALAIRFGFYPAQVRVAELIPLGYVAWRCAGLILMW